MSANGFRLFHSSRVFVLLPVVPRRNASFTDVQRFVAIVFTALFFFSQYSLCTFHDTKVVLTV